MKRILPLLSVLSLALAGWYFMPYSGLNSVKNPELQGEASEENPALREAWERQRLADPATGRIPEGIEFGEQKFAAGLPQASVQRSGSGWVSRGPYNYGGRSRALAIDVTNENRLLAGSVSGGVWLSEDGGQSWSRKTPLNAHPGCVSIAQDTRPGHTNTWYYLSGEVYGTSASGGGAFYLGDGMFKSTDGGNTWAPITSTAGGSQQGLTTLYQTGWRVITDPTAPEGQEIVYMATINAIYRSANGGTSWTAVRAGNLSGNWSYFTDVAISSSGVLYATLSSDGPGKGIYRSVNGTTWTNITPAFIPAEYDRLVIGINPNNEKEVYFFGTTPNSGHYTNYIESDDWTSLYKYTYISDDGSGAGGDWTDLSVNLPGTGTELDQCAAQGGYDLVVRVQPGTNTVFIGGTNIWRSTDGFTTPNNTTKIGGYKIGSQRPFFEIYPNHHPDIHDLLFLPSNNKVMLSCSDGGLHRTEDCTAPFVDWTRLNNGYVTTQFYTAVIDHNAPGDSMLLGGLQDNGNFFVNSNNPAASWRQTVNGDGSFGAVAPGKAFYVLSIQQGHVAKVQLDASGTVLGKVRIDPVGRTKDDYLFVNPLALDPNDANVLYLPAGNRCYRQDELGSIALTGVWDSISQGWTQFPDTITSGQFSAIAVSETNPAHRVYLGTSDNKLFRVDNANTGTPSFTSLPIPTGSTNQYYVNCIAVDPRNADRVMVVYSNYSVYSMFLSENAGQTWIKVAGNLEANVAGTGNAPSLRWLSILPLPDGKTKYFCGTSVGLFSADTLLLHANGQPGTHWVQEAADQIGTTIVDYVDTRASDGLVVAASHGNGMFTANFLPASPTVNPVENVRVQVFPNPASKFATIDIGAQSAEGTQATLFDLSGKQALQVNLHAQQQQLDLSGLPAGVYVWEVRGKNWVKRGKLVKSAP